MDKKKRRGKKRGGIERKKRRRIEISIARPWMIPVSRRFGDDDVIAAD